MALRIVAVLVALAAPVTCLLAEMVLFIGFDGLLK